MNSVKFQKIKLQEAYDLIFKPNYIGEGDRSLYPCVGGCEVLPQLGHSVGSILGWAAGRQCGPSGGLSGGNGPARVKGFCPQLGGQGRLLM